MVGLEAGRVALRSVELAAPEDLAATVATAATRRDHWRLVAPAAMPVLSERAAMAATELEVTAGTAAMAALAGRLMAATRLVAMAATALCSALVRTSR